MWHSVYFYRLFMINSLEYPNCSICEITLKSKFVFRVYLVCFMFVSLSHVWFNISGNVILNFGLMFNMHLIKSI